MCTVNMTEITFGINEKMQYKYYVYTLFVPLCVYVYQAYTWNNFVTIYFNSNDVFPLWLWNWVHRF